MPPRSRVETIAGDALVAPEFVAAWERMRCATGGGTAFARIHFARALADEFGYDLAAHAVRSESGSLNAGVLCHVRRLGPYRRAVVPPFVQYTPVLLDPPLSEHVVHGGDSPLQILLATLAERYGGIALNLTPDLQDVRAAAWSGYRVQPLYTYRIDLEPDRPVHSEWSENALRLFRRFTGDYTVVDGIEHARDVVQLCADGYARHERGLPVAEDRLVSLVRRLTELNLVQVYALRAREGETCEAGIVVLRSDDTAHYWVAGSRPGPAMTVLLGHVLERLAQDGIRMFDMVGANTPSIAEFKRKFGPRLESYYRLEATPALGLRLLDFARGRA
ncbi:MAG TPA: GNAT family N-acetyltransferase [Rhodothermales bacterium]